MSESLWESLRDEICGSCPVVKLVIREAVLSEGEERAEEWRNRHDNDSQSFRGLVSTHRNQL